LKNPKNTINLENNQKHNVNCDSECSITFNNKTLKSEKLMNFITNSWNKNKLTNEYTDENINFNSNSNTQNNRFFTENLEESEVLPRKDRMFLPKLDTKKYKKNLNRKKDKNFKLINSHIKNMQKTNNVKIDQINNSAEKIFSSSLNKDNSDLNHLNKYDQIQKINENYYDTIYSHYTNFSPLFLEDNKKYENLINDYILQDEKNKENKENKENTSVCLSPNSTISNDFTKTIYLKTQLKNETLSNLKESLNNKNNLALSTYGKFKPYDSKGLIFSMQSSYKKLALLNSSKIISKINLYNNNNNNYDKELNQKNFIEFNSKSLGIKLDKFLKKGINFNNTSLGFHGYKQINKKIKIIDQENMKYEKKAIENDFNQIKNNEVINKSIKNNENVNQESFNNNDCNYTNSNSNVEVPKNIYFSLKKQILKKIKEDEFFKNINCSDTNHDFFKSNNMEESLDEKIIKSKSIEFKGIRNLISNNTPFNKNNKVIGYNISNNPSVSLSKDKLSGNSFKRLKY